MPPGGLSPSQVPQFIMIGSDDNYYADGILWLVNTALAGKVNPDGTPAQMTFFITAGGGTTANGGIFAPGSVNQTPAQVISAWQAAYAAGHQIGNHTWDHDQSNSTAGLTYTTANWQAEINPTQAFLTGQANFPACQLDGFRFPYLAFDDDGFTSIANAGFLFDASMEFGYNWWDPPTPTGAKFADGSAAGCGYGCGPGTYASGQNYWWPFTLDSGPPSVANNGFDPTETKGVTAHAGVWEFLATTINQPPEPWNGSVPSGVQTVTGLDYNLWEVVHEQPTAYNFCDALKNTFNQRYNGNRAPWNFGIHSPIYSPDDPSNDTFFGNNSDTRRQGLQCFIDYLFSTSGGKPQFPDVRVVGFHKVIDWMRNPQAIH
jgi:hypothetical protein